MSIKQSQIFQVTNPNFVMQSLHHQQVQQVAEITKSRYILTSDSRSKVIDLFQTNQTCIIGQICPSCSLKTNRIRYYSCCLQPSCNSCYSGFHYLQCSKKMKIQPNNLLTGTFNDMKNPRKVILSQCQRCEQKIEKNFYSCQSCSYYHICEKCSNLLHKTSKFNLHNYSKHEKDITSTIKSISMGNCFQNILICPTHNKAKNILTESIELVCIQCFGSMRQKKFRAVQYHDQNVFSILKAEISEFKLDLDLRYISHKNKWNQLRLQLRQQFNKLYQIVRQRYEQNQITLNKMQEYDSNLINKLIIQSNKAIAESNIDFKQMGISNDLAVARLNILLAELSKKKDSLVNSQLIVHKIANIQLQKLQSLMRNFTISKLKLRQPQQMSIKKSQKSSINPNPCNLSVSRRSLSKSISKMQNTRNSIAKQQSSISRSKILSQQVCTQPLRNATPPQVKSQISSDKKSAILRQNSLMNSKLQDITPVALNFDLKETNGSRINFISSKTEDYSQNTINQNNISSQSRTSKRKSDYFQLRDRIRKPNIVNNRFSKR